jgi:hypothetical protein
MENASKALIIAGAILLSILLISLGIMVFRQASGVLDSGAMDEVEVTTFNSKFEQYFGDNVRGANVKALMTAVNNNNASQADASKQIKFTGKTKDSDIQTGKTYKVSATEYTTGGLISKISITENKK